MNDKTYSNLGGWDAPQGNAAVKPEPPLSPVVCSALRGDWNTHMPCGHLRQFGTLGDVFPVHCLACELEQLRQKLKATKRYLRAANKGAERNSIVAQLSAMRSVKLAAEIDALRKPNDRTERPA